MKALKNIVLLFIGAIFLLSSSGYVLYSTSCSCTGKKQTSVFVKPETCETSFHQHHAHDSLGNETACSEEECHDCQNHTKKCGCDSPKISFFKLKDKATNEKVRFIVPQVPQFNLFYTVCFDAAVLFPDDNSEEKTYADSPPLVYSSLDFLINIQQLKIPSLA